MADTPSLATLPRKQFCTGHIEYLPTSEPPLSLEPFAVRLFQPGPNLRATRVHLAQPILACLRIVLSTDPPLLLEFQVVLEEMQQIRAGHRAAREEVRAHPPALKVVRRIPVREDVHEQLPLGRQRVRDLLHQQLVVLHVLKQLDAHDPVVGLGGKIVRDHVARDDFQILETLRPSLRFDVHPLRLGV